MSTNHENSVEQGRAGMSSSTRLSASRPQFGVRRTSSRYLLFSGLLVGCILASNSAHACTACFGQSDSPLAAGMNWGIYSLLGFIGLALAGVAAFAIFLIRRSANALPDLEFESESEVLPEQNEMDLPMSRESSLVPRPHNGKVPHTCPGQVSSNRQQPALSAR